MDPARNSYKWATVVQFCYTIVLLVHALKSTTSCVPDNCPFAPPKWEKCVPPEHKLLTVATALFGTLCAMELVLWKVYANTLASATRAWERAFVRSNTGRIEYELVADQTDGEAAAGAAGAAPTREQLYCGSFVRWAFWFAFWAAVLWLATLVLWVSGPVLKDVCDDRIPLLAYFATLSVAAGLAAIVCVASCLTAWDCTVLRCSCKSRQQRARSNHGSGSGSDSVSRRIVDGAQDAAWNSGKWAWYKATWVPFWVAASAALTIGANMAVWGAHACLTATTSTATSTDDTSIAYHYDSCAVETTMAQYDGNYTMTQLSCTIRCASQPPLYGVTGWMVLSSMAASLLLCMRLQLSFQRGRTSRFRLHLEYVRDATDEAFGGSWQAEARRVEQLSAELVFIQHRVGGLGHHPSPWLINQIELKSLCVLRPLFDHHVRRQRTAWLWAVPEGPEMAVVRSELCGAVDTEAGRTTATHASSSLHAALSRLLSAGSQPLPSLNEVQDLGKGVRALEVLQLAEGQQHVYETAPQRAWDAALLVQLYWLCCTIPHSYNLGADADMVRVQLLGNVFFMLHNWKAVPEAGEHQLCTENSAAYRICNMLWQSKLHAEHHNRLKQAVCLIDPSDEEAEVEQLDAVMAFLMLSYDSVSSLVVDTSTSQPHTQHLDEQARHSAVAGAGAGTGTGASVGAGGPRASD